MYEDLASCLVSQENLTQVVQAVEFDRLSPVETCGRIRKRKNKLIFARVTTEEEILYKHIPDIITGNIYWINKLKKYVKENLKSIKLHYKKELLLYNKIKRLKSNKSVNITNFKRDLFFVLETTITIPYNYKGLEYHLHCKNQNPSNEDLLCKGHELLISYLKEHADFYLIHNHQSKKILTIKDIYKALKQAS